MRSTGDNVVNLQEAVRNAFGRGGGSASSMDLFQRAGFCEEDAERGARMLESGRYFGFADVVTSMRVFSEAAFRRRNPRATTERIAEVIRESAKGTDS